MLAAVEAVRNGMSIRKAAETHGVPRSSLGDRVSGKVAPETRPGKAPVIPLELENQMVDKSLKLADQGFGLSKRKLTARAGQLCKTLGIRNRFKNGTPGRAWWSGLKKRHPSLTLRKPEKLSTVRSRGVNSTVVGSYFEALHDLVEDLNPSNVWNMDETSLSLEHSPAQVVARKGSKVIPGRTSNSRESVTVLPCVNAAGQAMPPLIIVKGKTSRSLRSYNTHEGPAGALWGYQTNAWMSDELGCSWFEEVFLKNCGESRPQLLIMDNHRSHETLGLLEAAAENNIIVLTFPPHSTHYLCPLDRAVFGPFQRAYNGICSEYITSKTTAMINKITFPGLMNKAYVQSFLRTNIVSCFESTGIYKWDPLAIPAKAFEPSLPFDKETREASTDHPLKWVVDKIEGTKYASSVASNDCEDDSVVETLPSSDVPLTCNLVSPSIVDQEGNVVGEVIVTTLSNQQESVVSQSTLPINTSLEESPTSVLDPITEEEAAHVLVQLNAHDLSISDSSFENIDLGASGVWNIDLESMFSIQGSEDKENTTEISEKKITKTKYLT